MLSCTEFQEVRFPHIAAEMVAKLFDWLVRAHGQAWYV